MDDRFIIAVFDERRIEQVSQPADEQEATERFDSLSRRTAALVRITAGGFSIERTHGIQRRDLLACPFRLGSLKAMLSARGLTRAAG